MKQMSAKEFGTLLNEGKLENYVIVDCRSKATYKRSHIDGAINIPIEGGLTPKVAKKLKKDKTYYVLDDLGIKSMAMCTKLQVLGLAVTNIEGGFGSYLTHFDF